MGKQCRKNSKLDLIKKLQEKGVTTTGNIDNIRKLATSHGVPIVEVHQKIIKGWEGKPKGILQVLWEWGWIDARDLQQDTINGKKDSFGILQPEMSLTHLMANCRDYEEEELLLQSMGCMMGDVVDHMPKCHCELAGEGIEYSWGCSKNAYWQLPLSEKRGKQVFRNTVKTSCQETFWQRNVFRNSQREHTSIFLHSVAAKARKQRRKHSKQRRGGWLTTRWSYCHTSENRKAG